MVYISNPLPHFSPQCTGDASRTYSCSCCVGDHPVGYLRCSPGSFVLVLSRRFIINGLRRCPEIFGVPCWLLADITWTLSLICIIMPTVMCILYIYYLFIIIWWIFYELLCLIGLFGLMLYFNQILWLFYAIQHVTHFNKLIFFFFFFFFIYYGNIVLGKTSINSVTRHSWYNLA